MSNTAADTTKNVKAPKVETPNTDAAAEKKTEKPAAEVFEILGAEAVPMPDKKNRRGSTSAYPFDKLEIGQSIGVKGRTAEDLRPTVNNQNRKYREEKRDANGQIIYKMTEMKDQNGVVTGRVPTEKAEYNQVRRFEVRDVDPKTDPQNATARIWRVAP